MMQHRRSPLIAVEDDDPCADPAGSAATSHYNVIFTLTSRLKTEWPHGDSQQASAGDSVESAVRSLTLAHCDMVDAQAMSFQGGKAACTVPSILRVKKLP
jgi:hypothetical protein